jgi:hypothetical protein
VIFNQPKQRSIGRLNLFANYVLRTGDPKAAVLPEAVASPVIEFVVNYFHNKLLRGFGRRPVLRPDNQVQAEQSDPKKMRAEAWFVQLECPHKELSFSFPQ